MGDAQKKMVAVAAAFSNVIYMPVLIVLLVACGVVAAHQFEGALLSHALTFAGLLVTVWLTKRITRRRRPDGTDLFSFPSGHSATAAFAAAALLMRAFSWNRPHSLTPSRRVLLAVLSVLCMTFFVGVAWSRIVLQRHHLSDVLVGSTLGIAFAAASVFGFRRS